MQDNMAAMSKRELLLLQAASLDRLERLAQLEPKIRREAPSDFQPLCGELIRLTEASLRSVIDMTRSALALVDGVTDRDNLITAQQTLNGELMVALAVQNTRT